MKVIYIVDSISDLNNKINLLRMKFGENIFYVVRADLVDLFKTYNYIPHAIYYNNLTKVVHNFLLKQEVSDIVVYYSSLKLNNELLTKFTNSIGNKMKIVSLSPKYNVFEQICNSVYNVYVKSLFKTTDSMVSNKLQFIPQHFLIELLNSHLGNRLFEISQEHTKSITLENPEINTSMKTKIKPLKYLLISFIITLLITSSLLLSVAYFKVNYISILISVTLYFLNFLLTTIFLCKAKFDQRFLK